MNKQNFLQQFQLNPIVGYHPESIERVAQFRDEDLRQAAVVVGLVERNNELNVIFTKRAAHLKHHPGQVSFPGGKYEQSDPSLQHTALRELQEEIGYGAKKLTHLMELSLAPGYFASKMQIFLAEDLYQSELEGDEPEPIDIVPWPLELWQDLLQEQDFSESRSVSALFLAQKHLQLK